MISNVFSATSRPAHATAMVLFALLALAPAPAAVAQSVDTTALAQSAQQPNAVNIEADRMEVQDDNKRAIFSGNVDASRGDIVLKTDKLVADYVEAEGGSGGGSTEVTFLEASGNVEIDTARQRITGSWARMDVKANHVTVGGNVVVNQGGTVLTGEELFVDLNKNTSQLTGGRVKGSFVPRQ